MPVLPLQRSLCPSQRRLERTRPFVAPVLAALAVASTIAAVPAVASAQYAFNESEANFDLLYAATPIALTGLVLDEAGAPVAGAIVTTVGWGVAESNEGLTATTDASGAFAFPTLSRRSVLLKVERTNYYAEIVPVDLQRPLAEDDADAGDIVLTQKKAGRARLIFGGDTMLGRRFTDANGDGIEGEPGDLIRPTARAEDAIAVTRFIADALGAADYTTVNLETPATAYPEQPHPFKSFSFYSHPETLAGLVAAGVDGVSLGNNHVYDYLDPGLLDTLMETSDAGLDWCGAGMDETEARGSVIYRTVGQGVQIALQGFNQLVNDGTTHPLYSLVARDSPQVKGGALEMSAANVTGFVSAEASERAAIPMLHGGTEYSDYPSATIRTRMIQAAQQGAALVVAHHPHEVQGVGVVTTNRGPRLVLMSLGNLIFDQDVFETFQSYIAVVDIDQSSPGVQTVRKMQLVPIHIEGYVPKLVSGAWLDRAGREVGHLSTTLPVVASGPNPSDGLSGAVVFPSGNRVLVASGAAGYATSEEVTQLNAPLTTGATPTLEYVRMEQADSLARVQTSTAMSCQVGREISLYGDFEDLDVDDVFSEGTMWDQTSARFVQNSVTRSGTGALVLLRQSSNSGNASSWMRNRIKVPGNQALTLRGWVKGNNSGQFQVQVYWYTSSGATVSSPTVFTRGAGTYDWESFSVNLTAPANSASIRAYYRSLPPAAGEGATFVDDVSLVQWESSMPNAASGWNLPTPNAWGFVRCTGGSGNQATISLTHRMYSATSMLP
ncbi:CapA family protein [Chondromyces crocatus]|uniref:Carbohydrate-binding protein n=1 Tax=Chondromyces crocatus TaxID=52 RepID=A0A0K1EPS2_CHOCO|nr:CapA family protein [Chondromyces crocatus]AKT42642.1 carbohydrate-binding protein [Chondromyces crocatus]